MAAFTARQSSMFQVPMVKRTPRATGTIFVSELRLGITHETSTQYERRQITGPRDCIGILADYLDDAAEERIVVLLLDTKHCVTAIHTVAIGGLSSCPADARMIFRAAILANAAAIVLCHNHPSGDPTPSAEDVALTKRMVEAGKLLDVEVLDHIVIGRPGPDSPGFVSLKERGLGW